MNLTIGKNIRALRKQQSITQEALAEHLGVSYQSVSRWENEITYPDMELLPAIAGFFSVSVDALLGIPEAEKEAKAKAAMDDLRREILKKERNIPAIVEKIRDIRRNYLDSEHMWKFWNLGNDGCYRHPEVLPEVRLTAEAFLERVQSPLRYSAIELMSRVEDEEHVESFLKRYATDSDISKEALLRARYRFRREFDKYEYYRQLHLWLQVGELCNRANFYDFRRKMLPEEALAILQFQMGLLHSLCQRTPDQKRPISGGDGMDFLIEERLEIGFRMAECLSSLERGDEALTVLEDCVEMIEKIMALPEAKILPAPSPWLQTLEWEARPGWFSKNNDPDGEEEYNIWIHHTGYCYMIYPSTYYHYVTAGHGWSGFDPLRNDPRYQAITRRLQRQIRTRKKPSDT